MLQAVLLLFIPPLFLGFLWNSTWVAQTANHALEQTQLDAVTLSLCSQTQDFLQTSVRTPNRRILAIQSLLNLTATYCLTKFAATSAGATPIIALAELSKCVQHYLRPIERTGQTVESLQMAKSLQFDETRQVELKTLLHLNHLSFDQLYSSPLKPAAAGLKRSSLPPHSLALQSQLRVLGQSVQWPRTWVTDSIHFSPSYRLQFQYRPAANRGLRQSTISCEIVPVDPLGPDRVHWREGTP